MLPEILSLNLAIKKGIEPLLLLPISFGIFAANFPLTGLTNQGGLFYIFYHYGIETELIPPLIFLGLGAMTDFGPVIANPKTLLLGAAAQLGVYTAFFTSLLFGFTIQEAATIGIRRLFIYSFWVLWTLPSPLRAECL